MNKDLLNLYDLEIGKIKGSLYCGQECDMNNTKEVAAMMYSLGYATAKKEEYENFGNSLNKFFPPGFHGSN